MTKKPLDALSARIRDAINPPKKRQDATAKILDEVEPLPIVTAISQPEDAPVQNAQGTSRHATTLSELFTPSLEPPVENTLGKMTTLAKTEPSPWSKSTVVNSTMVESARVNTSVNFP